MNTCVCEGPQTEQDLALKSFSSKKKKKNLGGISVGKVSIVQHEKLLVGVRTESLNLGDF